jgi:hypothetical protein
VSGQDRLTLVDRLMERYNAQDADGYAEMFTETGVESLYRAEALHTGREGIRHGLREIFAKFPDNRADVTARYLLGEHVVLHEHVFRTPESDPFEVVSIYSFSDGLVDRVEFVR